MGDYVGSPFERPAVDRGGEGVVHNERNAVAVRQTREFLHVQHIHAGIGYHLAEHALGVWTESLGDFLFRCVGIDEGGLYTQLLQGHPEEVEGSAIYLGSADDMVSRLAYVEHRVEIGGLAG